MVLILFSEEKCNEPPLINVLKMEHTLLNLFGIAHTVTNLGEA